MSARGQSVAVGPARVRRTLVLTLEVTYDVAVGASVTDEHDALLALGTRALRAGWLSPGSATPVLVLPAVIELA